MENEQQIYTEVYTVLNTLPLKYIQLIPENVRLEIYTKADTHYSYKVDVLLPQSKGILIEIIRRYFKEDDITTKINEYINFCIQLQQTSENSKDQYSSNDIFKNKTQPKTFNQEIASELTNKGTKMIKAEENCFQKIIKKIKTFFGRR